MAAFAWYPPPFGQVPPRSAAIIRIAAVRLPALRRELAGVYQIGEVQARSWMEAGSPFGIGNPSRTASRVLQRGVGISRTRT